MNEVFILGSGFSKAVNNDMPLLNDLSRDIDLWFTDNKYKIKYYYDIYEKYIKSTGITNFEDMLTFLYQDFPWKNDEEKNILSALFIFISNLLKEILLKKQSEILNNEKVLLKFLNYIHHNTSKIITFNYDTLLEKISIGFLKRHTIEEKRGTSNNFNNIKKNIKKIRIIEDINYKYTSEFNPVVIKENSNTSTIYFNNYNISQDVFINRYLNEDSLKNDEHQKALLNFFKSKYFNVILKSPLSFNDFYQLPIERLASRGVTLLSSELFDKSFRLFKLHGSINWYYSNPEFGSYGQLYVKEDSKSLKNIERIYEKDLITLIIPPVFDKTNFLRIYALKMLWQEAQSFLSEADKVYIIGYSLPESDLSVRLMLQKNIKVSSEIFVVNNDKNVVERYKRLFYSQEEFKELNKLDKDRFEVNINYYDFQGEKRIKKTRRIILNFKYVIDGNNDVLYDFILHQLI